ncbi:MAG: hypothetical protein EA397_03140 [Deltaproteobacteria bacterium]|nr:MAG: hypothetical protein EA397_03140 [Deltaproteobacteria bacterium]
MNRARLALLIGLAVPSAYAGEVQFEGFYRARGRAFSSLSIDTSIPGAEGPSAWVQHRFWLQPRFVVNDKVAVYSEIRALDGVAWGQAPRAEEAPQFWRDQAFDGGLDGLPLAFTDDLRAPSVNPMDGLPRGVPDISIWRVWAEVHGSTGTWRFGRMPIHWGMGIWQNDGLGLNADYGDSADRVQWERSFSDIFVRVAGEVDAFGLANPQMRDMAGANAAVAYRGERLEIGLNSQVKHAFPQAVGTSTIDDFTLLTASAAFDAELGNLRVGAELVARVGQGALSETLDDVTVQAFGGVLAGQLSTNKFIASVEGGFATGDNDGSDTRLTTFAFDRDYNVGLIMFEQPMPIVRTGAGVRDLSQALTGNGVSNAFFGRLHGSYLLPHGLSAEVTVVTARTFQRPEDLRDQVFYGVEVDLGMKYRATEKLDLLGTSALFVPGNYYTNASTFQNGLSGLVIGGQVLARVHF